MVELDDEEEESHDMEVHMSCHLNDFIAYFVALIEMKMIHFLL